MKMKAKSAMAVLAVSTVTLAGCGGGESGGSDAAGSGAGDELQIRIGHAIAPGNPLHEGAERFKEIVEEETDGRISVEIFPSSQLGSETDMIEQVRAGGLEVVLASPAVMSNVYPDAAILAMPFALEGANEEERYESLVAAAGTDVISEMTEEMAEEAGMRGVDWTWWYGDRHITNGVRPIESVEDLEGLKLRTPDAPIHFLALEALGASVTPLAFGELYLALQTGTVDGQENPIAVVESQKFYEVQDHLALSGHLSQGQVFLFSEQVWDGMTADDQDLVQRAAEEAGVEQSQLAIEANQEALERLQSEHGMTVTELDVDALREATEGAAEQWAEENSEFSLERYEAFRNFQS